MRYIGNKTKLLGFIGSVLDSLGIRGGTAADPFGGTAAVAQYLKSRGFATRSSDLMTYSYVFQRAYVELDRVPTFAHLLQADHDLSGMTERADFRAHIANRYQVQEDLFATGASGADGLHQVLTYLDTYLDAETSLITTEFSSDVAAEQDGSRMFFTRENGRRIDAVRHKLEEWRVGRLVDDDEFYLLLACLLEAADAVANTTGVYAAYVKSWQGNARKPLRLAVPRLVMGTGLPCKAYQMDANEFVRLHSDVDVLYLDPPYNSRQYSSYYHVPELIARGWFDGAPTLRGKTGLIPDADKKSRWSVAAECVHAFRELMENCQARTVLLSYNSEGIIPPEAVEEVFAQFGASGTFSRHAVDYARYRSDRDHEQRVYKSDVVTEFVYAVRLNKARPERRNSHAVARPTAESTPDR